MIAGFGVQQLRTSTFGRSVHRTNAWQRDATLRVGRGGNVFSRVGGVPRSFRGNMAPAATGEGAEGGGRTLCMSGATHIHGLEGFGSSSPDVELCYISFSWFEALERVYFFLDSLFFWSFGACVLPQQRFGM